MPHRNRMLVVVVALTWIVLLAASMLSAALRSGAPAEEVPPGHSSALLAEAPGAPAANPPALTDIVPPA